MIEWKGRNLGGKAAPDLKFRAGLRCASEKTDEWSDYLVGLAAGLNKSHQMINANRVKDFRRILRFSPLPRLSVLFKSTSTEKCLRWRCFSTGVSSARISLTAFRNSAVDEDTYNERVACFHSHLACYRSPRTLFCFLCVNVVRKPHDAGRAHRTCSYYLRNPLFAPRRRRKIFFVNCSSIYNLAWSIFVQFFVHSV